MTGAFLSRDVLYNLPYLGIGNPPPTDRAVQDSRQGSEMDVRTFLLDLEKCMAARAGHLVSRFGAVHYRQGRGVAHRAARFVGPFIRK